MDGTNNRNENPQGRSVFEIRKKVGKNCRRKKRQERTLRHRFLLFFFCLKKRFFFTKVFGEIVLEKLMMCQCSLFAIENQKHSTYANEVKTMGGQNKRIQPKYMYRNPPLDTLVLEHFSDSSQQRANGLKTAKSCITCRRPAAPIHITYQSDCRATDTRLPLFFFDNLFPEIGRLQTSEIRALSPGSSRNFEKFSGR